MAITARPLSALAILVFASFLQQRAIAENTNQLALTYIETKEVGAVAVLLVRLSGALSALASCYILFNLIGTKKNRSTEMKSLVNRLLLMISIFDIISSSFMFMSSWLAPSSPQCDFEGDAEAKALAQEYWDIHYPGAIGNINTCTAQGFLIQIGVIGSSLFTAFVGIQTILLVRYNWTVQQMKKAEIAFFGIGLIFPLIPAIWALHQELYNPLNFGGCWLASFPLEIFLDTHPSIDQYCGKATIRGENIELKRIAVTIAWVILVTFVIIGTMISLFLFVRKQELRAARWSISAANGEQQKRVLIKAMLYIAAYLIVYSYWFVYPFLPLRIEFDVYGGITVSSQGFWNALIYSGYVEKCINRLCCCCCCFGSNEENFDPKQRSSLNRPADKTSIEDSAILSA